MQTLTKPKRFFSRPVYDPIVTSLTQSDLYKFRMGQLIWRHFSDVDVTFGLTNRTLTAPLGRIIPESQLREELDHVRSLRFMPHEVEYLRSQNGLNEGTFDEGYLQFLSSYAPPRYELECQGDKISLTFPGKWMESTYWEIYALKIVNQLYFRNITEQWSDESQRGMWAEGSRRLKEKIRILRDHPQIRFSEFGTRRHFSHLWQYEVVETLANKVPREQLVGTSNVYLAQKHDLKPVGTNAHELQMVMAGLMQGTDEELLHSQDHMLRLWWQEYGKPQSIFLPDTFGTESFLKIVDPEMLRTWLGFRQDSGDTILEGEMWIKAFEKLDIDSKTKLMIPSDGLDLQKMIEIERHFRGRLMISFGWGTNLTNDFGLTPLSIVVKAMTANGIPLVKLSNNPAKAMGRPEDIKRYIRVFGYGQHESTKCTY